MYVMNAIQKGMGVIIDTCLSETSKNPIEIIRRMMAQPFWSYAWTRASCYGWFSASTAYKNAGGEIDFAGSSGLK